eukprot:6183090-Pleurochrysis_carterae.AAC.2
MAQPRRRVVRGKRWRTARGGIKCASGRRKTLMGGERWSAAPGGERLDSARLRAASGWTAQGAGLPDEDSARCQAV